MDTRPQHGARSQPLNRRACDECRARKLGCSKERTGCSRCLRDGVCCHYSAQKPMGRPRKARLLQTRAEGRQEVHTMVTPVVNSCAIPDSDSTVAMASVNAMNLDSDLDMAFLDMNDVSFFDLLMPNGSHGQAHAIPAASAPQPTEKANRVPSSFIPGTHLQSDINFDSQLPAPQPVPQSEPQPLTNEYTPSQLSSLITSEITSAFPHSSITLPDPETTTTVQDPTPSPPASPPLPCSCIPTLYLALDSLQRLPPTVSGAIRLARSVARACHDSILCAACTDPTIRVRVHDKGYDPPIHSFQAMMMLGAILPGLADCYKRILGMVDREAAAAVAVGEEEADGGREEGGREETKKKKIPFELASYGGLWGALGRGEDICGAAGRAEGRMLEPEMWRLTVRALLRVDVYGVGRSSTVGIWAAGGAGAGAGAGAVEMPQGCDGGLGQPGLKDIIAMMEERSRARHETLEAMAARGELDVDTRCGQYYRMCSSSKPTCARIIDIAKRSMETLDIP